MGAGLKFDDGKPRLSLLPWSALVEIAVVQMYGAIKYDVGNWRQLDDADDRYLCAALRHLGAVAEGEEFDAESGLPHLAHAGCNVVFALWFYVKRTGGTPSGRITAALAIAREMRGQRLERAK